MQKRSVLSSIVTVLTAAVILILTSAVSAQHPAAERKILLRQDLPIPGYEVVQALGIIPPGGREGKHTHPGTMVGYVLEGELTMEIPGSPTVRYKTGDSFIVKPDVVHEGINNGKVTYKAEVTYIVAKDKPLTTQVH